VQAGSRQEDHEGEDPERNEHRAEGAPVPLEVGRIGHPREARPGKETLRQQEREPALNAELWQVAADFTADYFRLTIGLLLGVTLLFSGIRMLLGALPVATPPIRPSAARRWLVGLPIGGLLGLLAGMVGIGGGVFLAPLLHYLGWGHARNIAASASLFILLNSIAGLAGQLSKLIASGHLDLLYHYVWLVPAVLLGGQIGSRLGAYHLPDNVVRRLTAVLILYVALRLLWRWHFP